MANERVAHIWLIEDDPDQLFVTKELLKNNKFEVTSFRGGSEPLEQLQPDNLPDLILLDVMMPDITGLEVLRKLRSRYSSSELPIVLLTAMSKSSHVSEGLTLGANDYVTKPYSFSELLARIEVQLNIKRLQSDQLEEVQRLQLRDTLIDEQIQTARHDLNGLLNAIKTGLHIMATEDMLDSKNQEKFQAVLSSIQSAAGMMEPIISEFLDTTALKTKREDLELASLSMNDLVQEVVNQFRAQSIERDVRVVVELDETEKIFEGDTLRLKQVLGNLLSNAIKYGPGGHSVTIQTHYRANELCVEVIDTGYGFEADEIPRLFESSIRLRERPSGSENSNGIGLTVVRRLVELHMGEVGLESQLDKGSKFWFTLPYSQRVSPEDLFSDTPTTSKESASSSNGDSKQGVQSKNWG